MRSSLMASLLQTAKFNLDRKMERVAIFEVGRVFLQDALVQNSDTTVAGFHQPMRVGGLVYGLPDGLNWEGRKANVDFFDVKGHVEKLLAPAKPTFEAADHPSLHPGRSARILLNGQAVGSLGELHPKWRQAWGLPLAPVLFELELDALTERQVPSFEAFSKHQAVERDIAVWVQEAVTHAQLMTCIGQAPVGSMLRGATLFDVYRPKADSADHAGEKSLAVRLVFKKDDGNLTDPDVDAAVSVIVEQLVAGVGARQRT